jgi:tetratricopeptide (TPR) repeat protein
MQNFYFEYLIDQINKKNFKDVVIKTKENVEQYGKSSQFWNLRGIALENLGYSLESIDCFLKSHELNKKHPGALHNISKILFKSKNYSKSIEYSLRCLTIEKEYIPALLSLMNAYLKSDQLEKCIEITNKLIKEFSSKVDMAFVYNVKGCCYESLQEIETALDYYKLALQVNPSFVPALQNVANYYSNMGDIETAKKKYQDLLKENPNLADVHRRLTIITKYKEESDPHIKQMEDVFAANEKDEAKIEELGFALSKSKEDVKNYKDAFKYFSISNAIRDKKTNYNLNFQEEELTCISKIFTNLEKEKFKSITASDNNAIFILGMPRSGTTLLEQIISSHPNVQGLEEIDFLSRSITSSVPHKSLEEFYEKIIKNPSEVFAQVEKQYFEKVLAKKDHEFSHHTDKMPVNYKLIGFIKQSMPNAKVIHCVRDPKDIFVSILKNYFGKLGFSYAYDPEKLSHTLNLYTEYMHFWKKIYGDFIYDLKYEDLVNNPEKEIKNLLKFCNLTFAPECLEFDKNKKSVSTASTFQVRQPIYKTSSNLWKHYEPYLVDYFNKLKTY